jgi:hypothetical protein
MARPKTRAQINKKIGEGVSKITPDTLHKLEEAFSIDCTVEEASLYAGISPSSYYVWVKNNPKLLERFNTLRNHPPLKARKTIVESLRDPNHAFRYMERKRPEEFMPKQKIELNTQVDAVQITDAVRKVTESFEKQMKTILTAKAK